MNKKERETKKSKYDGKEDAKIKQVAHYNDLQQYVLLAILIILFGFTLFTSLVYVGKYYKQKNNELNSEEIIEIKHDNTKSVITNNGHIDKILTIEDDNNHEDVIVEKTNVIEITSEDEENLKKEYFNIRYEITENDFSKNIMATGDSDLLVRFSYSFDNEEWNYVTNAISYNDTNITPLVGSLYDISGLKGNIKVLTNFEMTSNPYEPVRVYWRCETIIKYKDENLGKKIQADFKISYDN